MATPQTLRSVLSHKGVRIIALGWTGFVAENVVLSHNREYIIQNYGDANYHLAYNTLSSAACASIAYGYLRYGRGQGPVLKGWRASTPVAILFQGLGLALAAQLIPRLQLPVAITVDADKTSNTNTSSSQPPPSVTAAATAAPPPSSLPAIPKIQYKAQCPMDFKSPSDGPNEVSGVKRITRLPMFWAFGLLTLGTAFTTTLATEVVAFALPMISTVILTQHQDYRHRKDGTLSTELDAKTSNVPFVALLTGKQSWVELGNEFKALNAAVAFAVVVVLRLRRVR